MHLGLLPSVLLLNLAFSFAAERAPSSRSLASRFNRNCIQQIEDENYPLCLRPRPPRDPSVHSYTISDPDNPRMRPFSFQLTVPKTLTPATWDKSHVANLQSTLPSILRQLGVDPRPVAALVSEGLPFIVAAIQAIQSKESIRSTPSDIVRREPTSNIRNWIEK